MVFVVTHWINLVAMIILIISGIYIHFPFVGGLEGICRGAHLLFGFVLFLNCVFRVVAAFFVKTSPTGGTREQVKDKKPGCLRRTTAIRRWSGSSTTCSCARPIPWEPSWACRRRSATCLSPS